MMMVKEEFLKTTITGKIIIISSFQETRGLRSTTNFVVKDSQRSVNETVIKTVVDDFAVAWKILRRHTSDCF